MKAVGYVRVSTSHQAEEGVSLEAQRAKIAAWCLANDYELVAVFEDAGISGAKIANRMGLQSAIAATGKGMALVSYSISRLARSTKDMLLISETLEKRGADLVSLSEKIETTSASGKLLFRIMAVIGEFEKDIIGERTATALRHKKANGEIYGTVPFGFAEVNGRLVEVESETKIVRQASRMRGRGASYQEIADKLNDLGVTGKQGGKWYPASVRYVLKSQRISE